MAAPTVDRKRKEAEHACCCTVRSAGAGRSQATRWRSQARWSQRAFVKSLNGNDKAFIGKPPLSTQHSADEDLEALSWPNPSRDDALHVPPRLRMRHDNAVPRSETLRALHSHAR